MTTFFYFHMFHEVSVKDAAGQLTEATIGRWWVLVKSSKGVWEAGGFHAEVNFTDNQYP